jgi:hypothetical protein
VILDPVAPQDLDASGLEASHESSFEIACIDMDVGEPRSIVLDDLVRRPDPPPAPGRRGDILGKQRSLVRIVEEAAERALVECPLERLDEGDATPRNTSIEQRLGQRQAREPRTEHQVVDVARHLDASESRALRGRSVSAACRAVS